MPIAQTVLNVRLPFPSFSRKSAIASRTLCVFHTEMPDSPKLPHQRMLVIAPLERSVFSANDHNQRQVEFFANSKSR
jgi:hypothetical protein